MNSLPHPSRLDPTRPDYEAILTAHDRARALGHSTYLDPSTGLVVQTVDTHLRRGVCCSSNCRHCPWVQ